MAHLDLRDIAGLAADVDQSLPSNRRLGQQIASEGRIDFTVENDTIFAAVTGLPGTSKRTVTFAREVNRIGWSCTCMKGKSPWCKHVVAAVIASAKHENSV